MRKEFVLSDQSNKMKIVKERYKLYLNTIF